MTSAKDSVANEGQNSALSATPSTPSSRSRRSKTRDTRTVRRTKVSTATHGSRRAWRKAEARAKNNPGSSMSDAELHDNWLDQVAVEEPAGGHRPVWNRVYETFGLPIMWLRRGWTFVSTTPGKMVTLTLILSIAILAAGYSMAQSADQRRQSLDVLVNTTEPMSYSAHNLYTSLSLADAIATTGFVQSGVENAETRARYSNSIDQAAIATVRSAYGTASMNSRAMELITTIQREVPVYTGLVETARANHRIGNPVGTAYMAEASDLMRSRILPAAAELFEISSRQVSDSQKSLSRPQWIPLSGLAAALLFLPLAQWWLWRITRRRLNRGFLVATALMAVAMAWVSASNWMTWQAGTRGFEEASMPWDSLTNSRIEAYQARTSETLSLVRRQSVESTAPALGLAPGEDSLKPGQSGEINQTDGAAPSDPTTSLSSGAVSFDEAWLSVESALNDMEAADTTASPKEVHAEIERAREALHAWEDAHHRLVDAINEGDYQQAVDISTRVDGPITHGQPTAAQSYARLDASLSRLISEARTTMRSFINDGLAATNLVSRAVMILSLLSVVAIWMGIRPRLQEYL